MNDIFTEQLISLRELALFAFAIFLLAAAVPTEGIGQDPLQQPVNITVPAEEAVPQVKSA